MAMGSVSALILAAGQGTRMKSSRLKVLHRVGGRTMIDRVVSAAAGGGLEPCLVVVGHQADSVRAELGDRVEYVHQERQLGTGHAVLQARDKIDPDSDLLVLYGDCPLVSPSLIGDILLQHRRREVWATILTAVLDDPAGYGRVIRCSGGEFLEIREDIDCTPQEASIREINTGMGCFRAGPLFEALERVGRDNQAGEYYLIDAFPLLREAGGRLHAIVAEDPVRVMGINSRVDLAAAEGLLNQGNLERLMLEGVTVVDPGSTRVGEEVSVGPDTVIHPGSVIEGRSTIGSECSIGPGAHVVSSRLGDRVEILHSVVTESRLEDEVMVGPFSHLRPGTHLARGVKVGNFAEIKNSQVGEGTKVPHHSYLGDAQVGAGVNLGAGSITVNYDGKNKHRTVIEDGAFIGCNCNLVAPVRIGKRAFVAAGTTVTKDVPAGALALARPKEQNIEGWVRRRLGPEDESGQ